MPDSPFDWNNYLRFAQVLVSTGNSETADRTATSRSYYAAYWKARQLLEEQGIIFPYKKSHEFCWESFSAIFIDGEQVGKLGFAFRDRRVHADYQDIPLLEKKSADSDVQDAAYIIGALSNLTETEKQTAVRRANQIFPNY